MSDRRQRINELMGRIPKGTVTTNPQHFLNRREVEELNDLLAEQELNDRLRELFADLKRIGEGDND